MVLRNLSFSVALLCVMGLIAGCASSGSIKKSGKEWYELEQYMNAADELEREFNKPNLEQAEKAQIGYMIGECYRKSNKADQASVWYQRAIDLNYGPMAIYYYAHMLKRKEEYELAIEQFRKYEQEAPEDKERAQAEIDACTKAIAWKSMKTKYVISAASQINSEKADFSPIMYENGSLVFTSDRKDATPNVADPYGWTGEKFSDLFISVKNENKQYTLPERFDKNNIINTDNNEGNATFNADYTEMYFTRCIERPDVEGAGDEENAKESPGQFCDIYYTKKNSEGRWEEPVLIEFFGESNVDVGHPALSPDGQKLVFTADAAGGIGGKDIYVSIRTGGMGWSTPTNLGSAINTDKDEMFPYIDSDGLLYFSSEGLPGMGGLDIFVAEPDGNTWGRPQNLQWPINSGGDDFGIMFDEFNTINHSGYYESSGYFTSSRKGGMGMDDIYWFKVQKPAYFELVGDVLRKVLSDPYDPNSKVIDYKPIKGADVELVIYDKSSGEVRTVEKAKSDEYGKFHFDLEPETDYKVIAYKGNFFKKSEELTTKDMKSRSVLSVTLTVEMVLDTIFEGEEIVLEDIYYDYDDWKILADAARTLDKLVALLKDNPTISVELGSHTDSRGSTSYNEKLSQRRAESCVKYLVSRGITKSRLFARGYGETQLLNNCTDDRANACTEEQHARNRRTTFKVLGSEMIIKYREVENVRTKGRDSEKPYEMPSEK